MKIGPGSRIAGDIIKLSIIRLYLCHGAPIYTLRIGDAWELHRQLGLFIRLVL